MSDVRMITVAELQKKFPTDPPPSERWISAKARALKLGKQYGKFFLVREDFIERYLEIETCQASGAKPRKTGRQPTPGGRASRSGKKTAPSHINPLSEALALARSPKLAS